MAVITLSRAYGCGVREMARDLAQRLGYNLFEKEMVPLLAQKLHRKKEFTKEHDELKDLLSSSVIDFASSRFAFLKKDSISPKEYVDALKDIFFELVRHGDVIVVGRGSQFILQNHPDVFHLRLIADIKDRVEHLKNFHFINVPDNVLIQRIQNEDHRRQEFLKIHFGYNGENPLLYHMTINLSKVSREKTKNMIIRLISENLV